MDYRLLLWVVPLLVILIALGRTYWAFRGSQAWPTTDGTITQLDVQRQQDAGGGHYFRAIFAYSFQDLEGHSKSGNWSKNFSTEPNARDFAARELPVGKQVVVRFKPKDPDVNILELDSYTYTDDRPTSLNL